MQLLINETSLAEDVKKIFTACYPFLKIELYKRAFNDTKSKKETVAWHLPLLHQAKNISKTSINIEKNKTVAELENDFLMIGLRAEVFRRSGNVWVETSLTTNWTLQQQNAEAEEICREFMDDSLVLR